MLFQLGNMLAFLLAAASVGYFVCIKANKEEGFLRLLGFIIGGLTILTALIFTIAILSIGFRKPANTIMPRQQAMMSTRPMMPQQPAMPRK